MKIKKRLTIFIFITLIISLILGGCSLANVRGSVQEQTTGFQNIKEKHINSKNIMQTIEELTSEEYKGRLAGTKGNELATNYIANYFKKIGLKNPDALENYLQHYKQKVRFTYSAPELEVVTSSGETVKKYEYIKDFTVNTYSSSFSIKGEAKGEALFVQSTEKFFDYSKKYTGKILLISESMLAREGNTNLLTSILLKDSSVGGIITEVDINKTYGSFVVGPNANPAVKFYEDRPLLFSCNSSTFKELIDYSKEGHEIYIKADYAVENVEPANVIGLIEGSHKTLKDEFIIIGAHFDHVGDNKNGTYNPGALDNASGTAVMMEIARVLKEGKYKPKKSILFIGFNGEEEGLYGSQHYTDNPIYPLKNTTAMINLDMVGSKHIDTLTLLSYDKTNADLKGEFYQYAKNLELKSIQAVGQGSDHSHFGAKGVSSLCLIDMDLKNGYHTPGDTIDNIDEDRIREIAKLVLYYIDKNAF